MDYEIMTLGRFRFNFNRLCENLREIFHSNYSFFTLLFLLFYSLEQALLIYFSIKLSPELSLGIGLFVLVLFTTIAIERLLMESRNKRLTEYNLSLKREKDRVLNKYIVTKRNLIRLKKK